MLRLLNSIIEDIRRNDEVITIMVTGNDRTPEQDISAEASQTTEIETNMMNGGSPEGCVPPLLVKLQHKGRPAKSSYIYLKKGKLAERANGL